MTQQRKWRGVLGDRYKLSGRTTQDVASRLKEFTHRIYYEHNRTFRGRKPGEQYVIGAVLLDFLARPFEEQLAVYDRWAPIYEEQVQDTIDADEGRARPERQDAIRPTATRARVEPEGPPPNRKRKGG